MNEREQAERFNRDVDNLLEATGRAETEAAPETPYELLALARALAETDVSAESAVRQSLRQRLLTGEAVREGRSYSKRGRSMQPNTLRRSLTLGVAAVILAILLTLTLPPVRAFAVSILHQIGGLLFTNEQTLGQKMVAEGATPPSSPTPGGAIPTNMSHEEVSALTGLPVYAASYLPEGYEVVMKNARPLYTVVNGVQKPTGLAASTLYRNRNLTIAGTILMEQVSLDPAQPSEYPLGDAKTTEVTIHGLKGLFAEQAPLGAHWDGTGQPQVSRYNLLVWDEGGFTFFLWSDVWSQEEILKVAESIAP